MKQILLVENDAAQRHLVRLTLRDQEYDITEAENGKLAVQFLQERNFDAILLDLGMPVARGEMVIQWIVANRPELKSKLLIVSGDLMSEGLDAMVHRLKIPLLSKPFHLTELVEAVKRIVGEAEEDGSQQPKNQTAT